MKKYNLIFLISILLMSCTSYISKEKALKQVCNTCILESTGSSYYAVDTAVNPNKTYQIRYNLNNTEVINLIRLW